MNDLHPIVNQGSIVDASSCAVAACAAVCGAVVPYCPYCGHDRILHVHTRAYPDLQQTHMSGSERFCCEKCKATLTRDEAEAYGFVYVLDVR